MSWFKVDDSFWCHPKVIGLSDAATALWVRAGSWSCQLLTDGAVPSGALLTMRSTQDAASELVREGLWDETETGWQFHDWDEFQPSAAAVKEKRARDRERKRTAAGSESRATNGRFQADSARNPDGSLVEVTAPEPEPLTSSKEEVRDDIQTVHEAFNESLKARGIKPKRASKTSIRAVRLMLDTDGHTVDQILRCIEWVTASDFWSTTVLSLPTLRKKYDTLRLQAQRDQKSTAAQAADPWASIPWAGDDDE